MVSSPLHPEHRWMGRVYSVKRRQTLTMRPNIGHLRSNSEACEDYNWWSSGSFSAACKWWEYQWCFFFFFLMSSTHRKDVGRIQWAFLASGCLDSHVRGGDNPVVPWAKFLKTYTQLYLVWCSCEGLFKQLGSPIHSWYHASPGVAPGNKAFQDGSQKRISMSASRASAAQDVGVLDGAPSLCSSLVCCYG